MPVFTILATPTQVNLCIDTSIFQERNTGCREARIKADIETTVTIKEHGILAILLEILLISQEHRYLRSVFAGIEYCHKLVRIKVNLRSTENLVGIRIHIIFISSTGYGKWSKSEETFLIILISSETYRAKWRQFYFQYFLTIQSIYIGMVGCIFIIRQEQFSTYHTCIRKYIFTLRNQFRPVFQGRLIDICYHKTVLGCIVVCKHINLISYHFHRSIAIIHIRSHCHKRSIRFTQVFHIQSISAPVTALIQKQDSFILIYTGSIETLGVCRILIDQLILWLRRTHLMIINFMILIYVRKFLPFHRSIISTVIEAISLPSSSRKLRPFDMIIQQFTGFRIHHIDFTPIRSTAWYGIRCIFSIIRERDTR